MARTGVVDQRKQQQSNSVERARLHAAFSSYERTNQEPQQRTFHCLLSIWSGECKMYQPFGLRGSRLPSSLLTGAVSGWPTIQELLVMLCRSGHGSPWVSPFPKCVRNCE